MSDFKCPMCTDCPHNCPLENKNIDTRKSSADQERNYSRGRADEKNRIINKAYNFCKSCPNKNSYQCWNCRVQDLIEHLKVEFKLW